MQDSLETIIKEVKSKLDKNPNFEVRSFVVAKKINYGDFYKAFESRIGFKPQDYKSYMILKEKFNFDSFKKFIELHLNEDTLIFYLEVSRDRLIGFITKANNLCNEIKTLLHLESGNLGLSANYSFIKVNDHKILLYQVLDKEAFSLEHKKYLEKLKEISKIDKLELFTFKNNKKGKNWARKYNLLDAYNLFLREIYNFDS